MLSVPLPSAGLPERIRSQARLVSRFTVQHSFLLNAVSPAGAPQLLPCRGETGRRLWWRFQAQAAPARSTLWAA